MYLSNTVTSVTLEGRLKPLPEIARPNKTTRSDGSMEFPGRRIDYGYMPAAHTEGDLYVHIPDMNVLVASGVVSAEQWPILDYHNGAWPAVACAPSKGSRNWFIPTPASCRPTVVC